MQPLSRRTRRVYLFSLVVLFFIALPAVIFYAHGYRIQGDIVLKTGGIFLSVPYVNAEIALNGEVMAQSGLLRRTFYLDELAEGSYSVEVTREGDHPWRRTLVVQPELVTDADIFLIPTPIDIIELTIQPDAPTTTERISRTRFAEYLSQFRITAPTTTPSRIGQLEIEEGNIYLRWTAEGNVLPSAYCVKPLSCVQEIAIEKGKQQALHASFFSGGIVYATKEGGVYITEADTRPTPLTIPLYSKPGSDFRILDNRLIIKDGARLYEIQGL